MVRATCKQGVSDSMRWGGRESLRSPTHSIMLFKTSEPKLFGAIKSFTLISPGNEGARGVAERQCLCLGRVHAQDPRETGL